MKEDVKVYFNMLENIYNFECFILIEGDFYLIIRRFYKGFSGVDLIGRFLNFYNVIELLILNILIKIC